MALLYHAVCGRVHLAMATPLPVLASPDVGRGMDLQASGKMSSAAKALSALLSVSMSATISAGMLKSSATSGEPRLDASETAQLMTDGGLRISGGT